MTRSFFIKKRFIKSLAYIKCEFNEFGKYDVKDITFYDDVFLMHSQIRDILKLLTG
ncbi:MAG: hypothetical protein GWP03_01380 [Proteobacteria bacterium]|nr:hypothetical protein [Pseudomonadota bacterium]